MAKEYIERDAALYAIDRAYGMIGAYGRVERIPAADVVEVVRCAECQYFGTDLCALDTYLFEVTENGFCNYGERRDNE